jgi:hypothetical protein
MDTNEKVSSQPEQVQMECGTPSRRISTVQMMIKHEWIVLRNDPCKLATFLLLTYITERERSKGIQNHNVQ